MRPIDGPKLLRDGKSEQRQRAIGFEFEQPLRQRAGLDLAEAAIEHKDAHEAEDVGVKIRRDDGRSVRDL